MKVAASSFSAVQLCGRFSALLLLEALLAQLMLLRLNRPASALQLSRALNYEAASSFSAVQVFNEL